MSFAHAQSFPISNEADDDYEVLPRNSRRSRRLFGSASHSTQESAARGSEAPPSRSHDSGHRAGSSNSSDRHASRDPSLHGAAMQSFVPPPASPPQAVASRAAVTVAPLDDGSGEEDDDASPNPRMVQGLCEYPVLLTASRDATPALFGASRRLSSSSTSSLLALQRTQGPVSGLARRRSQQLQLQPLQLLPGVLLSKPTAAASFQASGGSCPMLVSEGTSSSSACRAASASGASTHDDFERLSQVQLFCMYTALDIDGDTVLTSADLFSFIAANPQAIDTIVGQHVGLISGADQYPYWARVDSSRLGSVPIGPRGLVLECGPANWRRPDHTPDARGSGFGVASAASSASQPSVVVNSGSSGPLWWLRHRTTMHHRDKKFVDFLFSVAFSVLTKNQCMAAAAAASQACWPDAPSAQSASPGNVSWHRNTTTAAQQRGHHHQRTFSHGSPSKSDAAAHHLSNAVFLTNMAVGSGMATGGSTKKKARHPSGKEASGRTPLPSAKEKKSKASNKKYDMLDDDDSNTIPAPDDDPQAPAEHGGPQQPPTIISFHSFCLLYEEVLEILSAKDHAFMLAVLDVPMLLSVHTFFRFVAEFCRQTGRMPSASSPGADYGGAAAGCETSSCGNKGVVSSLLSTPRDDALAGSRTQPLLSSTDGATAPPLLSTLPFSELVDRIPRAPATTCASCIAWLVGAWEQQRGMLHVPVLQRVGEQFLKRKALEQHKQLKHFMRCFRHVWGVQPQHQAGGGLPFEWAPPSNASSGKGETAATVGSTATTTTAHRRKQQASSNLQQMQVRGRLASMRVIVVSSASDRRGDGSSGLYSFKPTTASGTVGSSSASSRPPTTHVPSEGRTPPTRSVSPGGFHRNGMDDLDDGMDPDRRTYASSTYGGQHAAAAVGSAHAATAQDATNHVVHALAEPEPLSMIASLSADEREKLSSVRFWCLVRACVYSLVAALVVGVTNLLCQVLFFSTAPSVFDSSVSSSQALYNWITGSVFMSMSILSNSTATSLAGNATTGSPDDSDPNSLNSLGLKDVLKYQLVVSAVALAVSIAEIIFLYLDSLQVCFSLAKTGGIPLHRYSIGNSKESTAAAARRGWDDSVLSVKDGLSAKRIRFVVAVISRCALQISFDARTVLSIDVSDNQQTVASQVAAHVARRFSRFAPTLVVRVLVGRILTKFIAPFIATPLMVLWNFILARRAIDTAASVVLGAVSSERLARQLLDVYFPVPPAIIEHNSRAQSQLHTAAGSRDGGAVKIAGLHQAHFHVYRELVALVAFYMHFVGTKTVHPSLHIFLAYIAAHVQLPEECLLAFASDDSDAHEKKRRRQQQSDRRGSAGGDPTGTANETSGAFDTNDVDEESEVDRSSVVSSANDPSVIDPQGSDREGSVSFYSAPTSSSAVSCATLSETNASSPSTHTTLKASQKGALTLTGVAGASPSCFLPTWLATLCLEMNILRQELLHTSRTDWAAEYVLAATTPGDAAARSELCSRAVPSVTHCAAWEQAKLQHVMEQMFCGWVQPTAAPRQTVAAVQADGATPKAASFLQRVLGTSSSAPAAKDSSMRHGKQQQQQGRVGGSREGHASYMASHRSAGATASPFGPRDVEMLAVVGILCCLLSTACRDTTAFEACARHTLFLHELAASYHTLAVAPRGTGPAAAASSSSSRATPQAMGQALVREVQQLAARYTEGCALDVGHILGALHAAVAAGP